MKNNVCPVCGCEDYIVLVTKDFTASGSGHINLYACPCCCNVYVQRSVVIDYFDRQRQVDEYRNKGNGRKL